MSSAKFAPVYEIRESIPGGPETQWRRLLTHIEIRRVQNGFVIMGFNCSLNNNIYDSDLRRVCFVCETVESLCATIASLATDSGDFAWVASTDVPITNLFKTYKETPSGS